MEYIQGDINTLMGQDLRLQNGTFDFVFHRMLVAGITDWPAYVQNCFKLLRPGGYVEFQDNPFRWYDIDSRDISREWQWLDIMKACAARKGVDLTAPERMSAYLHEAGFVDVNEKAFIWSRSGEPWETYPDSNEIGEYSVRELRFTAAAMLAKLMQDSGEYGEAEVQAQREALLRDNDMAKGGHSKLLVVCGRKP